MLFGLNPDSLFTEADFSFRNQPTSTNMSPPPSSSTYLPATAAQPGPAVYPVQRVLSFDPRPRPSQLSYYIFPSPSVPPPSSPPRILLPASSSDLSVKKTRFHACNLAGHRSKIRLINATDHIIFQAPGSGSTAPKYQSAQRTPDICPVSAYVI